MDLGTVHIKCPEDLLEKIEDFVEIGCLEIPEGRYAKGGKLSG